MSINPRQFIDNLLAVQLTEEQTGDAEVLADSLHEMAPEDIAHALIVMSGWLNQ